MPYRLLTSLVLMVLMTMPAVAREPGHVKIAAYNIENAFDVFDDPYTADERTPVKPRGELELVARAIRAMNADVVAISEVENEPVLRALVDEFLADQGYEHVTVMRGNDGRGIDLGIISRFPIRSVTSYRWQRLTLPGHDRTWRFARDLMHAQLEIDGDDEDGRVLHVFVVHYKSKRSMPGDEQANNWRSAEALRTRQIVSQLLRQDPDALAVVAGDFNDNPDDAAMGILLKPDDDGSRPLTDVHADIPREDRITFPSTRFPNTIFDYILASPAMTQRYVAGSAGIFNDPKLTGGSDHYPVYATFDLSR